MKIKTNVGNIKVKKAIKIYLKLYKKEKYSKVKKFIISIPKSQRKEILRKMCKKYICNDKFLNPIKWLSNFLIANGESSVMYTIYTNFLNWGHFLCLKEYLNWFISIVAQVDPNDDPEGYEKFIKVYYQCLSQAVLKNRDAFRHLGNALKIKNYPFALYELINIVLAENDITKRDFRELTIFDVNNYFKGFKELWDGYVINTTVDDLIEIEVSNHYHRIEYILANYKIDSVPFDLERFGECCICLDEPFDVIINKCGHFCCSICFFKFLTQNKFRILCPICKCNKSLNLSDVNYSYFPLDELKDCGVISRSGSSIISIDSNNRVSIYV